MAFPLAAIASAVGSMGGGKEGEAAGAGGGGGAGAGKAAMGALSAAIKETMKALGTLAKATGGSGGGAAGGGAGGAGGAAAAAGAAGGVSSGMSGMASAFGKVVGAAGMVVSKFNEIVATSSRFVSAYDPALVEQLNITFKQLDATVGQALRPVISAAIDIIRGFGGAINQAMRDFAPIIEKVTDAISTALLPVFDYLAEGLEYLMPAFDSLGDIIAGVADIFFDLMKTVRVFMTVYAELFKQFFGALFGDDVKGDIKELMEMIRQGWQMIFKQLILAVASFLKFIGAMDALGALKRGLTPAKPRDDIAQNLAPSNAQFKGLADASKSLIQAAFIATAQGGKKDPKKTDDFLQELVGLVENIAGGGQSSLSKMIEELTEVRKYAQVIWREITTIEEFVKGFMKNPLATLPAPVAAAAAPVAAGAGGGGAIGLGAAAVGVLRNKLFGGND